MEGSNGNTLIATHLSFADGTIIFCLVEMEHIRMLELIVLFLEAVTGLSVNLSKIVQVETMSNVERFAMAFGCKGSSLPMTYLGLPLGSHFKAGSMWIDIIDRMER